MLMLTSYVKNCEKLSPTLLLLKLVANPCYAQKVRQFILIYYTYLFSLLSTNKSKNVN